MPDISCCSSLLRQAPLSRFTNRAVGEYGPLCSRQQQHHRMFGDGDGIDVADDGERDVTAVEFGKIDAIVTHPMAGHHFQPPGFCNGGRRERLRADDDRIRFLDEGRVGGFGNILDIADGEAEGGQIAQHRLAGRMKFSGHEKVRHSIPPLPSVFGGLFHQPAPGRGRFRRRRRQKARIAGYGRHVEAPFHRACRVIRRAAMEGRLDAVTVAGIEDALDGVDDFRLFPVEGGRQLPFR